MMRQQDHRTHAYSADGVGAAFDAWLRRDLGQRFGNASEEAVPTELLQLMTEIDEPQ